jgi:hypothetical protein
VRCAIGTFCWQKNIIRRFRSVGTIGDLISLQNGAEQGFNSCIIGQNYSLFRGLSIIRIFPTFNSYPPIQPNHEKISPIIYNGPARLHGHYSQRPDHNQRPTNRGMAARQDLYKSVP